MTLLHWKTCSRRFGQHVSFSLKGQVAQCSFRMTTARFFQMSETTNTTTHHPDRPDTSNLRTLTRQTNCTIHKGHSMTCLGRHRGDEELQLQTIRSHGIRTGWVVKTTLRPLCLREKEPGEPRRRFAETLKTSPLRGFDPRTVQQVEESLYLLSYTVFVFVFVFIYFPKFHIQECIQWM